MKVPVGGVVPPLVLEDGDGQPVVLEPRAPSAEGRLLLHFWASYCRPCLTELPRLEELHRGEGQSVVAISVDVPDERPRAREALEQAGTSFPSHFLALDEESNEGRLDELVDLLRLPVPTTVVVDGEGRIVEVLRRLAEEGQQGGGPAD